jgi:molecular chaperone GrpE
MARFITSGLIQELLPVFDSFDLALDHGMDGEKERGVLLIRSQFEDVARKRGLERIRVEAGEAFNPERHESIGEVNSGHAAGTIAEIVQQGYMFRGRVLRPARVRLSKGRNDN